MASRVDHLRSTTKSSFELPIDDDQRWRPLLEGAASLGSRDFLTLKNDMIIAFMTLKNEAGAKRSGSS